MILSVLQGSTKLTAEFKDFVSKTLMFFASWNHPLIKPDVQQMYPRRKPALNASNK